MTSFKFIRLIGMRLWINKRTDVCHVIVPGSVSHNIALQDTHFACVADHCYVPQAKHHHVHRARMATRNWLFSHIWGTHAQNVAVSVLYLDGIISVVSCDCTRLYLSLRVNKYRSSLFDIVAHKIYMAYFSCIFIYFDI